MRPDTTELVVRLVVAGPGTFDWDGVNVGDHAPVRHAAVNGGFERGSAGWVLGAASVERTRESSPSRRGRQHLKLLPGGQASTRVGLASSPSQPWIGEQPVMGAWLRVCLLDTTDAADDPFRAALGVSRVITKKIRIYTTNDDYDLNKRCITQRTKNSCVSTI